MCFDCKGHKGFRLLNMFELLNKGELIKKEELAQRYGVTEKTIQRDIDELRAYLADTHFVGEVSIHYDRTRAGYYLVRTEEEWLTNEEIFGTVQNPSREPCFLQGRNRVAYIEVIGSSKS